MQTPDQFIFYKFFNKFMAPRSVLACVFSIVYEKHLLCIVWLDRRASYQFFTFRIWQIHQTRVETCCL